jgi:hypothetical protein
LKPSKFGNKILINVFYQAMQTAEGKALMIAENISGRFASKWQKP